MNSRIVQRFDRKFEAATLPSNSVHLDYKNVIPQFSILIDTLEQVNTVNRCALERIETQHGPNILQSHKAA